MPRNTRWSICVDQAKRVILTEFLEAANWKTADAANLMQMSQAQVQNLMRQHNVKKPKILPQIQKDAEDTASNDVAPDDDDLTSEPEEPETTDESPNLTAIDGGLDD